jgi:hypothetical protein
VAPFIAPADELEEQMRCIRLEGQVAEFIDDQELELGVIGLFESFVFMRLGELSDKVFAGVKSTVCPATMASRPIATARSACRRRAAPKAAPLRR